MNKIDREIILTRLAKILGNIGLFCAVVTLFLGLMPVIKIVYYLIALLIATVVLLFWLLSLIALHPFNIDFLNGIFTDATIFATFRQVALRIAPVFCAVAVVFAAASIPLILYNKKKKPVGRIVASSISIGIAVIGIVALYLGGNV